MQYERISIWYIMNINDELIRGKYLEMKSLGLTEDFLDKKAFGALKIFINSKPKTLLFSCKLNNTDIIYVGVGPNETK